MIAIFTFMFQLPRQEYVSVWLSKQPYRLKVSLHAYCSIKTAALGIEPISVHRTLSFNCASGFILAPPQYSRESVNARLAYVLLIVLILHLLCPACWAFIVTQHTSLANACPWLQSRIPRGRSSVLIIHNGYKYISISSN